MSRVVFDRIGRRHDIAPLPLSDAEAVDPDVLAERVHRYARGKLNSRDYEVRVDLDDATVDIYAGFRPVGHGRIEADA